MALWRGHGRAEQAGTSGIPPALRRDRGVLIVDHEGFGNVVMSLPLITALCRWADGRWPTRILLRSPHHFELIRAEGLDLLPVYYLPRYQGRAGAYRLFTELRGSADLIVAVPQVRLRHLLVLKAALGARYTAGEAFRLYRPLLSFPAAKGWTRSILATQEEIAASLGIGTPLPPPTITVTAEERAWSEAAMAATGAESAAPVLGVHCSGLAPSKRWPAERFGEVVRRLKQRFPGLCVISFGTSGERADADTARRNAGDIRWVEGTGAWSIRQTLAVLQRCDLLLSGDTSLMHMAAAVGTRTVSLFGPTSASRLAPCQNNGIAITPGTSCHPCYRDRYPKGCRCIEQITPEQVVAQAGWCLLIARCSPERNWREAA